MDAILSHSAIFGDMLTTESTIFLKNNPDTQQQNCHNQYGYYNDYFFHKQNTPKLSCKSTTFFSNNLIFEQLFYKNARALARVRYFLYLCGLI
jgi:hypothetical protein